jgi:hypothetical protein
MAEEQVTQQALERKRRFLEQKEKPETAVVSGDQRPYVLYFNQTGNIVCYSKEKPAHLEPDWLTADFNQEQLARLRTKDLNQYWVKHTASGPVISLKPMNTFYSSLVNKDLCEIDLTDADVDQYEITVQLTDSELIVQMMPSTKQRYQGMYPISATIKGKRILNFFIVDPEEDSYILQTESVSMVELLVNEQVTRPTRDNLSGCRVFTVNLFDKYARVRTPMPGDNYGQS